MTNEILSKEIDQDTINKWVICQIAQNATEVEQPSDLEHGLADEIAAKQAEIQTARANRPPTRAEYIAILAPLQAELRALQEQHDSIQERNAYKISVKQAEYEAMMQEVRDDIAIIHTDVKSLTFNGDPVTKQIKDIQDWIIAKELE